MQIRDRAMDGPLINPHMLFCCRLITATCYPQKHYFAAHRMLFAICCWLLAVRTLLVSILLPFCNQASYFVTLKRYLLLTAGDKPSDDVIAVSIRHRGVPS